MNTDSKNPSSSQSDVLPTSRLFDDWIDPIESGVRARVRDWIEALVHSELDAALQRPRYGRSTGGETEPAVAPVRGYRNGSRTRTLTGTFGKTDITVPRARLQGADGATTEWKIKALRAYQRRTKAADALIASAYLSGTNTRRVRRALAALFGGAVGKDTVSRVWRKVQTDWDAWNARPLKDEPIVRLILDGTVVRVRLDKKATAISLLVVIGVREDGQKAARRQADGRGDHGRLASCPGRPHEPRPSPSSVRDCRRRRGPRVRARGRVERRARAAVYGPQASEPVGVRA